MFPPPPPSSTQLHPPLQCSLFWHCSGYEYSHPSKLVAIGGDDRRLYLQESIAAGIPLLSKVALEPFTAQFMTVKDCQFTYIFVCQIAILYGYNIHPVYNTYTPFYSIPGLFCGQL